MPLPYNNDSYTSKKFTFGVGVCVLIMLAWVTAGKFNATATLDIVVNGLLYTYGLFLGGNSLATLFNNRASLKHKSLELDAGVESEESDPEPPKDDKEPVKEEKEK